MTRTEHNRRYGVQRRGDDRIFRHLPGYGELSPFDPRCLHCWQGQAHTWDEHDATIEQAESMLEVARGLRPDPERERCKRGSVTSGNICPSWSPWG
jgi:hypothetical protein